MLSIPHKLSTQGEMIRQVQILKSVQNNRAVFKDDFTPKENPVDMISVRIPGESVMGSCKRLPKSVFKTARIYR